MQKFTYHCHTDFSDGLDSLENMVIRAQKLGFTELGITDHLIVHKDFPISKSQIYIQQRPVSHIYNSEFKAILPAFQKHCDNLRKAAHKFNFKIYVGFEVDYFIYDGWEEELKDFLTKLDYDYLICGNHMMFDEDGRNVFELNDLKKIYSDEAIYKEYLHRHFETIKKSVESGLFKFLAHLDYARKLGEDVCSSDSYKAEKVAILDSLEKFGVAAEVSTKGLRKIGDFYPGEWIIKEFGQRGISVVISDDAHRVEELGADFDKAEQVLQKHNIIHRLSF